MSSEKLSKKLCFALAAGLAVASLALPVQTDTAVAAGHHYRASGHYRAYGARAAGQRQALAGLYNYAGGRGYAPGSVYARGYGTPYIFIPGRGILGAPCGLPTSACPNSARPAD